MLTQKTSKETLSTKRFIEAVKTLRANNGYLLRTAIQIAETIAMEFPNSVLYCSYFYVYANKSRINNRDMKNPYSQKLAKTRNHQNAHPKNLLRRKTPQIGKRSQNARGGHMAIEKPPKRPSRHSPATRHKNSQRKPNLSRKRNPKPSNQEPLATKRQQNL